MTATRPCARRYRSVLVSTSLEPFAAELSPASLPHAVPAPAIHSAQPRTAREAVASWWISLARCTTTKKQTHLAGLQRHRTVRPPWRRQSRPSPLPTGSALHPAAAPQCRRRQTIHASPQLVGSSGSRCLTWSQIALKSVLSTLSTPRRRSSAPRAPGRRARACAAAAPAVGGEGTAARRHACGAPLTGSGSPQTRPQEPRARRAQPPTHLPRRGAWTRPPPPAPTTACAVSPCTPQVPGRVSSCQFLTARDF